MNLAQKKRIHCTLIRLQKKSEEEKLSENTKSKFF